MTGFTLLTFKTRSDRPVWSEQFREPAVASQSLKALSMTRFCPSLQPSQVVLQGEGQWREAAALRQFKYSCNLDQRSGEAVGVVIRHADPPLAAQAASVLRACDRSRVTTASDPGAGVRSMAACA